MGGRRLPRAQDGLAPDRRLTPLAFREWGEPRGRPLLCWPGLNLVAHVHFEQAAPELVRRGFRVFAVVPPGWGTEALPPEDYRPTALVRRIVRLLDALALDRVMFVGWSWGASIGCHLAALAPERLTALALLDAGYTDFQDRPDFEERTLADSTAAVRARTPRFSAWHEVPEHVRAGFHDRGDAIVPLVAPEVVAAAAHGVVVEPPSATLATLGRLDLPILLVAASETVREEWGARALARFRGSVPNAGVVQVDSSHDLLADAPAETLVVLTDWLARRG